MTQSVPTIETKTTSGFALLMRARYAVVILAAEWHVVDADHFAAGFFDIAPSGAMRHVRPDVIVADQIPAARAALFGEPVDRRLELPRRRFADHEQTGRALAAFINRRVDVRQPAAQSAHQSHPHGADMHADHRLGLVVRDQVEGIFGHQIGIGAGVGENQFDLAAQNAAGGVHLLRGQHRAGLT